MGRISVATVKIKNERHGHIVINKSDYDESIHELYEVKKDDESKTLGQDDSNNAINDDGNNVVKLALSDLAGREVDDIKDAYNMDVLRALGKEVKVKNWSQMKEEKLVKALLKLANG